MVLNSSIGNFNLLLVKLRSFAELIGTRCKCAWGTSIPITLMPQRLQSKDFSMAWAIGFAKTSNEFR